MHALTILALIAYGLTAGAATAAVLRFRRYTRKS